MGPWGCKTHANDASYDMPTKLEKPIKREVIVRGQPLVLSLTADGVTITEKGHRKGKAFTWWELWAGEVELAQELRASVDALTKD